MKKNLITLKLLASIASTVDSLLNEVVKEDKQPTTSSTKVDFEKIKAKAQERHKQIKDQVTTLVSNVKENDEVNELMKMVSDLKDTISTTNNGKVVAEVDEEQNKNFKHGIEITKSHVSRSDYTTVFQTVFELSYNDASDLYEELKIDGIAIIRCDDVNKLNRMCSIANRYFSARYSNYKPVFRITSTNDGEPKKETNNDTTYHLIRKCERSNEALQRGQAINVSVTKDSMLADGYNPDYAEEAFTYLKKLFGINMSTTKLYITVLSEIANMPSHYVVVVNGTIFTGVHGTGFYVEDLEDFD